MATFYNQATLSFGGRVTSSNITEGEIVSGLTLTKTAITENYGPGDGIVYAITLTNAGTTDVTGISVTDDLGAYTLPGGTTSLVPLTYVDGSLLYYQNGTPAATPDVTAGPPLVIGEITVPAGGNVLLIYEARANDLAPLSAGSSIFNTATIGGTDCEASGDTAEVPTREEPILSIAKAICPATVSCGQEITYTFIIQNTGNTPVATTDNLTVSDTFTPALSDIEVTLNGTALTEGVGYTYNEETGNFATIEGAIPVPAATFNRDVESGVVTTTPGVAIITVTGTI